MRLDYAEINGLPGFVLRDSRQHALQTMALETDGQQVTAIYVVRNPDKLAHVAPPGQRPH
jgi:RNA polymerase sigma-70 factor (ECF subfamily)